MTDPIFLDWYIKGPFFLMYPGTCTYLLFRNFPRLLVLFVLVLDCDICLTTINGYKKSKGSIWISGEGGGGGGGVTSYGLLFQRCHVYDWPHFFNKKYMTDDFSRLVYERSHFFWHPGICTYFSLIDFWGCLFSWYSMNWLQCLYNYQQ